MPANQSREISKTDSPTQPREEVNLDLRLPGSGNKGNNWLLLRPRVLLCDSPSSYLAVGQLNPDCETNPGRPEQNPYRETSYKAMTSGKKKTTFRF